MKQCVCGESSVTNDAGVLYKTTITKSCSHVFLCRIESPPDGKCNLVLRMAFLVLAGTAEKDNGVKLAL